MSLTYKTDETLITPKGISSVPNDHESCLKNFNQASITFDMRLNEKLIVLLGKRRNINRLMRLVSYLLGGVEKLTYTCNADRLQAIFVCLLRGGPPTLTFKGVAHGNFFPFPWNEPENWEFKFEPQVLLKKSLPPNKMHDFLWTASWCMCFSS